MAECKYRTYSIRTTCRSCLCESNEMVSLLSLEDETQAAESRQRITIGGMMMEIAGIQIDSNDGLPQSLCRLCVSQLQSAFAYRKQCERSEAILREYLTIHLSLVDMKEEQKPDVEEMIVEEHWHKEESGSPFSLWDVDSDNDREMSKDDNENGSVDGKNSSEKNKNIEDGSFDTQTDEGKTNRLNSTSEVSDGLTPTGASDYDKLPIDYDNDLSIAVGTKRLNEWISGIREKYLKTRQHSTTHGRSRLGREWKKCTIPDRESAEEEELVDIHLETHVEELFVDSTTGEQWIEEGSASLRLCDGDSDSSQQMSNDDIKSETRSVLYAQTDETIPDEDEPNRINSTSRVSDDATPKGLSNVGRLVDDEDSRMAKRLNGERQCVICNKLFTSRQDLITHARSHLGKESERCTVCDRSSATKWDVKRHMNTHNKPKETVVCQRLCRTKIGLSRHIRRSHGTTNSIHVDADPSSAKRLCPYCGKIISNGGFKDHIRRHTGEKPFACNLCDKAFSRSTDLKTHRLIHTGEKSKKCQQCDKAFSAKNQLSRHMRTHTKEKPYSCSHCDRAFAQSNDLVLHVRRHTGEKPFKCGVCGERFYLNTLLNKHRRARGHFETAESLQPRLSPSRVNNV